MKNLICILVTSSLAFNAGHAQNWENLNSGTSVNLSSVCFPSATTGYVAGDSLTILKSTNGGINWAIQNTSGILFYAPYFHRLSSICFIDTDSGFVTGECGMVFKTTDGSVSWGVYEQVDEFLLWL